MEKEIYEWGTEFIAKVKVLQLAKEESEPEAPSAESQSGQWFSFLLPDYMS